MRLGMRRHKLPLIVGVALAALAALCAWGGWVATQPEFDTFLLQGAHDVRHEQVGPGMQGLMFSYDGPVVAQSIRLYRAVERRGWQVGQPLRRREDCYGACILGEVTLVFTRKSLFGLVNEVATVEQHGVGPYHVRVVLRRCYRLPGIGCLPRA
jgi:hypothetical protein